MHLKISSEIAALLSKGRWVNVVTQALCDSDGKMTTLDICTFYNQSHTLVVLYCLKYNLMEERIV